jgi:hypothetical protein
VLPHETYCKALGECRCDVEHGRHARRTARSLTIASGVTSPALDDAVLALPDVVRAMKRGELVVTRHVPVVTPPLAMSSEVVRVKSKNKRGVS